MSLPKWDPVRDPVVHPLCQSGHHKMCKMYEERNFIAKFPCACTECNHPFPEPDEPQVLVREAASFLLDEDEESTPASEERTAAPFLLDDVDSPPPAQVSFQSAEKPDEPSASPEQEMNRMATATKDDKSTTTGRGRGELEAKVMKVTEAFEDGKIDLPDGQALTPHFIAKQIAKNEGLEKPPSTGAVSAVIKRWEEYGYALTDDKPFAYRRISAAGKKQGLDTLKEKHREKLRQERAAEREAAKKES